MEKENARNYYGIYADCNVHFQEKLESLIKSLTRL